MLASVIVPTYKDTDELVRLLEGLKRQSVDLEEFEVLIVDNHTNSCVKVDLLQRISLPIHWEVLHCDYGGSYAARNIAVKMLKSEVLFFTDADCVVDRKWIENGLLALKRYGGVIGGHIELFSENKEFSALEVYERCFYFNQRIYIEKDHYSVTANMIVSRSDFLKVGHFDDSLRSGGDRLWGQLCQKKSIPITYCSEVKVSHPTRSTLSEFLQRRVRVLSGQLYLFHRDEGLSWKYFWQKFWYFFRMKYFRTWLADWSYFDHLSKVEQRKVRLYHRFFTLFDIFIMFQCKWSFQRLKNLTLIDR